MTSKEISAEEMNAGVRSFYEGLRDIAPGGPDAADKIIQDLDNPSGQDAYLKLFTELSVNNFPAALSAMETQLPELTGDLLHSADGRANAGRHIIKALQKQICTDQRVSKELRDALNQAKKQNIMITDPTAVSIMVTAAGALSVAIASLFSAAFAAIMAPLIGGVALFIMRVGVDAFCGWAEEQGKPKN
ncbi:hypothetical protein AB4Y32_29610 [Paraburkholderia phymatum]|uniref:Uncharacterized protein n=1 Tax=Paraburkholderia phymatum TaxID=148447 RepID=A0ACC6U8U4_9BURK